MKTIKFNHKSWHAHLVQKYSPMDTYGDMSFCSYLWGVVLGTLSVLWITVAGIFCGFYFVMVPLLILIVNIETGITYFPDDVDVTVIVWFIATIIWGFYLFLKHQNNKHNRPIKKSIAKQDSFIVLAYRKFKEKTCFRVELT